jgi:hypothetical protein
MKLTRLARVLLYTVVGSAYAVSLTVNVCRAFWPHGPLDRRRDSQ